MGISTTQVVTLSGGCEEEIYAGPCMITSVVVTELTNATPAAVALAGKSDMTLLMTLSVTPGQSVVWSGEPLVAGSGLVVSCQFGEVCVTVGYR